MSSNRPDRVASLILQVVSQALLNQTHDDTFTRVVLTGAKMTRDLKIAHLYYTLLGDHPQTRIESADEALARIVPFMRRQIGREVRLKFTPALQFHYDETLERARRVEDILAGIQPIGPEGELDESTPGDEEQ